MSPVGPPKPSPIVRSAAEARRQLEELYAISDVERQALIEWIATLEVPAALQKTLAKGTDLEMVADAWCPACNGRVKVRTPDYRGCAAFIKLLFEYKLQRPSERREVDISVTHRNLVEMGSEEREAYRRQLLSRARLELPPGPSAA